MSKPIQLNSEAIASASTSGTPSDPIDITAYADGYPNETFILTYQDLGNGTCTFRINQDHDEPYFTKKETSSWLDLKLLDYTINCKLAGNIPCVARWQRWVPAGLMFYADKVRIEYGESYQAGDMQYAYFFVVLPTSVLPPPVPITEVPPGQS